MNSVTYLQTPKVTSYYNYFNISQCLKFISPSGAYVMGIRLWKLFSFFLLQFVQIDLLATLKIIP